MLYHQDSYYIYEMAFHMFPKARLQNGLIPEDMVENRRSPGAQITIGSPLHRTFSGGYFAIQRDTPVPNTK
jgi:hypothetical protein